MPLGKGIHSWASLYYSGQNGKPYSLRFNGDANADTVTSNDLIFVPATADQVNVINGTWEQLDAFLSKDPAASKSRGQIMERNIGRAPWFVHHEPVIPVMNAASVCDACLSRFCLAWS